MYNRLRKFQLKKWLCGMKDSMHKAQAYDLKRETKSKCRKDGFLKLIKWKHKINLNWNVSQPQFQNATWH